MSFVTAFGFISLCYLAICLAISLFFLAFNRHFFKGIKPLKFLSWFIAVPLVMLDEILNGGGK